MDPALRDLVATGPLCHLTTLNPDGSPQVTVVWVGADGEDLVTAHLPHNQKVRNMERDPRVILLGEDISVGGDNGGVFSVTRGLFEEFGPHRVRDGARLLAEGRPDGHRRDRRADPR